MIVNDWYREVIDIDYSNSTFNNFRVLIVSLRESDCNLVQYTSNRIFKIDRRWTIQFETLLSMVYKGV